MRIRNQTTVDSTLLSAPLSHTRRPSLVPSRRCIRSLHPPPSICIAALLGCDRCNSPSSMFNLAASLSRRRRLVSQLFAPPLCR